MWMNYLKTGLRNLARNKLFAAINIMGLAIGMAAFVLILLFVRDEVTFDQFWPDSERLFRLETTYYFPNQEPRTSPATVPPVLPLVLETYAEVETSTRMLTWNATVERGDDLIEMPTAFFEGDLFGVFPYSFLVGDAEKAFAGGVRSIVLPQEHAVRLYGSAAAAMGQTLRMIEEDYVVTGVIEDLPRTSHMDNQAYAPLVPADFERARWFTPDWRFAIYLTYLKLASEGAAASMEADFERFIDVNHPPQADGGTENSARRMALSLRAVEDIHLVIQYGEQPTLLYGFAAIALLVLLIAVMNFLNLSMARTAYRAREVAVRKVVGAKGSQIVQQFLGEAILITALALLVAIAIVEMTLPWFNGLLATVLALDVAAQPVIGLILVGLLIMVGLGAGSLHSAFFAKLDAVKTLKGQVASDGGSKRLRGALVLGQFTISMVLMISALIVSEQTHYARTMNLGFNVQDLWIISSTSGSRQEAFMHDLVRHPVFTHAGRASDVPTRGSEDRLTMRRPSDGAEVIMDGLPIDDGFVDVFQIPLIAGRPLDDQSPLDIMRAAGVSAYPDAVNVLINRMGAEKLGFQVPEMVVGQTFDTDLTSTAPMAVTVVGVIEDFHFDDVKNVIRPGIYYLDANRMSEMAVRHVPGARAEAMALLETVWQTHYPDDILRRYDMDELVAGQYRGESELAMLLSLFTGLAVVISMLGLYGLAAFTTERRVREIGIRKVLGAAPLGLVALLAWQFAKPILMGAVIAVPLAWWFSSNWLEGFVYRISLTPEPFLMVVSAALAIGLVTVSGYALKAARTKPIEALRHE